jgi:fibronectin type 3 domain-containing protein
MVPAKAQSAPTYFYVVTAVDSTGAESVFSNQVVAVLTQGKHIVTLSYIASTSTVVGYNVYRGTVAGGPYTKINASLVSGLTYTDTFVLPNAPSGLTATIS